MGVLANILSWLTQKGGGSSPLDLEEALATSFFFHLAFFESEDTTTTEETSS